MVCGVLQRSWSHVEQAPVDPILGVGVAFNKDPVRTPVSLAIRAWDAERSEGSREGWLRGVSH